MSYQITNVSHGTHNIARNLGSMNIDELLFLNNQVVKQIKTQRTMEAQKMRRQLFVGSAVSFEDNDGNRVMGTIKKVMRKFAQVRGPDRTVWRVPLSHLTKESK